MTAPIPRPRAPRIPKAELRIETFRASGPGGQHLHKTESAVRLTHLPTGISVTVSDTRSQARNRALALERLAERLRRRAAVPKPRKPTRPGRKAVERRLTGKRQRAGVKALRGRVRED